MWNLMIFDHYPVTLFLFKLTLSMRCLVLHVNVPKGMG